jgi:hypothetical protein
VRKPAFLVALGELFKNLANIRIPVDAPAVINMSVKLLSMPSLLLIKSAQLFLIISRPFDVE